LNATAFGIFLAFVAVTLAITAWAARGSKSRSGFYTASGGISGMQNGLAFAGDSLSAAALLGVAGLYYAAGLDGILYGLGALIGWPALLFLMADRLRRLGRFTVADVLVRNLDEDPIRVFLACANLSILMFYMISQVVAAGLLVQLLLGVSFGVSAIFVGVLMITYVFFGGMVATTWVQIVKASLLILAVSAMAVLVLARFGFDPNRVFAAAVAKQGLKIMRPGGLVSNTGEAISLGLTLIFGPAGLPHLLMRFFTVPDAAAARKSAFVATMIIGAFTLLMIIIGYGAIAIVSGDPLYASASGGLRGGGNMAALHLAHALGGDFLLGVVAAVAFATILAVVSGITLTAAATVSHDLYGRVLRKGRQSERSEIRVARAATIVFGVLGIALSFVFKDQNVTFLSAFAFSVAASASFPLLFLSLFWPRLTTAGALSGGLCGLICALLGLILGPPVWVAVLGYPRAIFPYQYPTIVSMPVAFAVAIAVSKFTPRRAIIRQANTA
jgi:cation/acetate symporter